MFPEPRITFISTPKLIALRAAFLAAALFAILYCAAPRAEESKINEDAKKAGHAIGSAARDVNEGAKKIGKTVAKDAVSAAKTVSGAAREGAKEVKRAFKKEKE